MRSKLDEGLIRRTRKKVKLRPGGKVLQRLFAYQAERNPALNDGIVATFAVPKAARPAFGLTKQASRAKPDPAKATRGRQPEPAARSFASAIIKAAAGLSRGRRKARPASRKVKAAALLAPTPVPTWQSIGPSVIPNGQTYGSNTVNVSGRVSSIAVDPKDPRHLLLGAAGGGIWESKNTGAAWSPCTDQMPSLAIGAIAFDPTTPKRVYAGSGEGNFYATLGAGVYKSIDGGTTWAVAASAPFLGVGFFDLLVDPVTPATLYAATTNGFYKSTNSGGSWSLKKSGPCWDISLHPSGGSVEILAAFADGIFVSTDAGNTFSTVTLPSAPTGAWVRLAVDRVSSTPDIAYAFGAVGSAAPVPYLWRRAGGNWTRIPSLPKVDPQEPWTGQAWYDWYVAATPNDPNQVYIGGIDSFRGTVNGSLAKWINITTQGNNSIHPDQHCLTFAPNDPQVIYAGCDGGIFRSANSGATWVALNKGLGITEIEYLAGDPNTWKWLMAGTQDNGTICYTGSPSFEWDSIAGGDGGDCGVDQSNPLIVYHSYYNVSLERSTNKGGTWTSLGLPWPPTLASLWYPPVEVFGSTVAIGAASLLVTRNGMQPWTTVALGIPTNEFPSAMRDIDANTILVGTTAGRVLKVSWNGSSWSKAQLASPTSRYISCVAIDPSNAQRIWVTISQIGGGMVYRSDNGGSSWINCTAGLPNIPMNAVVVDPANYKRIWVAADVGVYQTLDLGSSWKAFSTGLPNAMSVDLLLHKQDRILVCATRNRGAWAIPVQ